MKKNDLDIVCTIEKFSNDEIKTKYDHPAEAHAKFEIEHQHGTWNKNEIAFFIKGSPDELFEERSSFMRRTFNVAFTEWDIEIPLKFFQVYTESEADIIIEWGPKQGDRFYPGEKSKYVLAYAGYPSGAMKGYMKIFTDWDWDVSGDLNIVTVIIHELGHLIGRPHSKRKLWLDLMDPALNPNNTELSDHDILGATTEYGIRQYRTESGHDRLEKANRHGKNRLQIEKLLPILGNNSI